MLDSLKDNTNNSEFNKDLNHIDIDDETGRNEKTNNVIQCNTDSDYEKEIIIKD